MEIKFDGNFTEKQINLLKENIKLNEQEIIDCGGCSFSDLEAYIEVKDNCFYVTNKNVFVRKETL